MLLPLLRDLGGVAPARQVLAAGVSAGAISAAVRRGDVLRPRQGWVALPTADPGVIAAVRVGGALSCTTLLRRHRLWTVPTPELHVRVVPSANHLASPFDRTQPLGPGDPVVVHHTGWLPRATDAVDSLAHALAVSMACQPALDAVATLDSAVTTELFTLAELRDVLAGAPAKYQGYLSLVRHGTQSGLETKARLRLRSLGIRVRSQVRIAGAGHVDLLVGERLVLELDGYEWHSRRGDFEEDRRRDLELAARGYHVIRLSYRQVTDDWAHCEKVILRLVRAREHLWPRSHA